MKQTGQPQLRHVKHPFPAVIDGDCRILILGSVPSVKSVENNFYYGHPQNRFWKVISAVLNQNTVGASKEEKSKILLSHGIALYDSVEECDIIGSSDSAIKNIIPADVPSLISVSKVERIFCNGNASYNYLTSFYPQYISISQKLPSTSPANASFSLERLINEYGSAISPFLK